MDAAVGCEISRQQAALFQPHSVLIGLDAVRAELMPEDKVTAIRELAAGQTIAMVG